MMKISASSTGNNLDAGIDPRFGRCAFFVMVDTETMAVDAFANEFAELGGGAGIQAASFVASKGATAVLTGNCGPNAMTTFEAAGITVYAGQKGTVRDAVERVKAKTLTASAGATVAEKAGLASDSSVPRTQGAGKGGGRGMGGGGGRGMGGGGRGCGGRGMGGGLSRKS